MTRNASVIGLMIANPMDRQLMSEAIAAMGQQPRLLMWQQGQATGLESGEHLSLLLVDSQLAPRVWQELLALKKKAIPLLLPLLVINSGQQRTNGWIERGADDILQVPMSQSELKARLTSYLHLYQQSVELARRSQGMYEAFVAQMQDGVVITNTVGEVIKWNPALEAITDIKAEEAIGRPLWDSLMQILPASAHTKRKHAALRAQIQAYLQAGQAPHSREVRSTVMQRPDGTIIAIEHLHFPIYLKPDAIMLVGFVRDVSARQRIESDLQQYTKSLEHLYRVTKAVTSTLDFEQVVNIVLEQLLAVVSCQSAGLFIREGERFRMAAVQGVAPLVAPLGQIVPESDLFTTIAQRRHPLILADASQDARFESWVPGLTIRGWMGLPLVAKGELLGIITLDSEEVDAFQPADAKALQPFVSQIAQAILNARLHQQEIEYRRELEQRVAQRTQALRQRTEEAEALNAQLAALVDQLSESNLRHQQVASELQRLNEELQSFSYSVSHDLKAPLRAVNGYSQLLSQACGDQLDAEGRLFLDNIQTGVQQMTQLIDDILAYSRLERRTLRQEEVDLPAFVSELLAERSQEIAERDVAVTLDIPPTLMHVDREALAIVLRNLIDNALKYTQTSSRPTIRIAGQAADTSYTIAVEDNGIGFDMIFHDQLFEIFQRLHTADEYPGTGIGLAMVRKAVTRMGGRVWAQSQEGQGATFLVEVPR